MTGSHHPYLADGVVEHLRVNDVTVDGRSPSRVLVNTADDMPGLVAGSPTTIPLDLAQRLGWTRVVEALRS